MYKRTSACPLPIKSLSELWGDNLADRGGKETMGEELHRSISVGGTGASVCGSVHKVFSGAQPYNSNAIYAASNCTIINLKKMISK